MAQGTPKADADPRGQRWFGPGDPKSGWRPIGGSEDLLGWSVRPQKWMETQGGSSGLAWGTQKWIETHGVNGDLMGGQG